MLPRFTYSPFFLAFFGFYASSVNAKDVSPDIPLSPAQKIIAEKKLRHAVARQSTADPEQTPKPAPASPADRKPVEKSVIKPEAPSGNEQETSVKTVPSEENQTPPKQNADTAESDGVTEKTAPVAESAEAVKSDAAVNKDEGDFTLTANGAKEAAFPETVRELFSLIYADHPSVKSARERQNAAKERVAAARTQRNPNLSFSGFAGQQEITVNGQDTSVFRQQADFTLDQPLYTGGRADAAINQSTFDYESEKSVAQEEVNQLLRDAGESFVRLASERELIKLYEKTVDVLQRRYDAVRVEEKNGERTLTDIALSESRMADAQARLAKAKADLKAEEARFFYFVGGRTDYIELAKKGEALEITPIDPEDMPDIAQLYVKNAEMRRAQYQSNSAEAGIDAVEAQYRPQISLEGRVTINESRDTLNRRDEFDNHYVIARATVPLYARGAEYAEYNRAEAISRRAKAEYLSVSGDVLSRYREAIARYQSGVETVQAFEVTQKAAQKALKGVRLEYQYGFRTILDVLDAERDLLQTGAELINAKADRLAALIDVKYFLNELAPVTYYN